MRPIGVFDSGIGGLSIVQSIIETLPCEDIIYFADQKNIPYGEKSEEFLQNRSTEIVNFLLSKNCKLIVVACNTATTMAIKILRERFSCPIVGVEPAIKPALEKTTGLIGVLTTVATSKSEKFNELIKKLDREKRVIV